MIDFSGLQTYYTRIIEEMKEKHAYLIMAHTQFEVLRVLLGLLDYGENDIYLHIDKKVKNIDTGCLYDLVKEAKLKILDNRVNVKWGTFSQIECELRLLEEATKKKHSYYHLMSGVDLPLKSQKEIHAFFERSGGQSIFILMPLKLIQMRIIVFQNMFFLQAETKMFLKKSHLKF